MRRSKEKHKESDKQQVSDVVYPFRPILSVVPNNRPKQENSRSLKTLHWNANSVVGKINKLENLIREEKPDIISLNETRTNTTTEAYIYELAGLGYFPIYSFCHSFH